ncbi:hypothetical protein AB0H76_39065 [Nocardia sp. NPDC050712]|uniref:hypothetical protein n=1 Tax=Actinomycetes TaxID=1760 RepID=UPI00341001E4
MSTPESVHEPVIDDSAANVTGLAANRARGRGRKPPASRKAGKSRTDQKISSTDRIKMLAELGHERYEVGRNFEGQVFLTPRHGAPVARMLEGFSAEVGAELALALHKETGEVFTGSERREALLNLSDKAFDAAPIPTAVRIANPSPDSIAIDLCNEAGEYVLITRKGWTITSERGRVAFVRGPRAKALPYPVPGGDVSRLWELMNIAEPMRPMILANFLTAMQKAADHPILSLTGQAGSAKTTTSGMYSYLLDPIEVGEGQGIKDTVIALQDDIRDIYVTAGNRYFLPYDNIDSMTRQQQTALSIISTGGMRTGRTLYTDGATTSIPVRGCLTITAIDPGKLKPDFLDRVISVEVQPIPGGVFRTPGEVMRQFDLIHGEVLGGLFDLAAQVLAQIETVRKTMQRNRVRVARMADFSYLLATVDKVMGTDGFATFMRERDERQAEVATSDPLSVALMSLISTQDKGEGVSYTPTELLKALNNQYRVDAGDVYARPPKGWPETPVYLSRQINLLTIPLRDAGYTARLVKTNGARKWQLARTVTAHAPAAAVADPMPLRPEPADPEPARVAPIPVSTEGWSKPCKADHHDECARDRAANWIGALDCLCPCHNQGGEQAPLDFAPVPDPQAEPGPEADELEMLAALHGEDVGQALVDEPGPEPEFEPEPAARAEQFSARRIVPWTVKPSAYVNLALGEGLADDGTKFTVRKRGSRASLAELLRAVPEGLKFVHLTGCDLGTEGELLAWANTALPKGWTAADRVHASDEARERVSLRYRRPDGTQLVIYRAAAWIDRNHETVTTPADLRAAFAVTLAGIRETFGEVVAGDYGVPLKSTPAATGLELIRRTLPHKHQYPMLDDELQHLIRSHAGQARTEDFAAETHPSGGRFVPDRIPGLYVYDIRFAYAALLDQELPSGPVVRDEIPEFARRGSGWEPCLYRVRVTVPAGWDRAGRFRRRDGEQAVWIYPSTPGETFEAWTWERGLDAADKDGWRIGEHVQILERIRFTGPKTKPLMTFGKNLRRLRDEWLLKTEVDETVRELARIMVRQIAIAAIGKLAGTPYAALRSCPIDDLAARPAEARRSSDGKRWEWREMVAGRNYLVHPEWASYIWAICRDWLYSHPTQKGVGLRHVPRSELIAARTDGFWTSTPQPVPETSQVGHFRVQLAHEEALDTPRSYVELNNTRAALLEAAR